MTPARLVFELPALFEQALAQGLQTGSAGKLREWMASAGLPAEAFSVAVAPNASFPGDRVARLFLEGEELLYPEALAGEIGFSISRQVPDLILEEKNVIRHFEFEEHPGRVLPFYLVLFREICQWNCEWFITPAVVDGLLEKVVDPKKLTPAQLVFAGLAFKEAIKAGELSRIQPAWLMDALVSVGNGADPSDACELLLDQTGDPEISLYIAENYLKALTIGNREDTVPFKKLDEDLFYALGIDFPDVRILFDDQMADQIIQVSINGIRSLELQGLSPGEYLVKAEAGELERAGYSYTRCLYPGWSERVYRVRAAAKEGLSNYNPISALEFIAFIFYKFLSFSAWQFIKIGRVRKILTEVNAQNPLLTELALGRYTLPTITAIFRRLMKENISIRNVEVFLQAIIDFDWIEANETRYIVFDDRLPVCSVKNFQEHPVVYVVEFIRTNLKNYICSLFRGPNNTLPIFVADPGTEQQLISAADHPLGQDQQSAILSAVRSTIGDGWLNAEPVNMVTTSEARPLLRSLLQRRFPFINVFSQQELSPFLTIQVSGRMKPVTDS